MTGDSNLKTMSSIFTITVKYDQALECITGTDKDTFTIELAIEKKVDVPFNFVMYSVENIRPEVFKRYPPGKLDFKLNGANPKQDTVLKDGDEVWFGALKSAEV